MAAMNVKRTTKRVSRQASSGSIEKKGGIAKNFLIFFYFFIGFVSLSHEIFRKKALGRGYEKASIS
jgi:hypothetical protein